MSDYEPPMPIMKAVAASISQNTEQNVPTRDEQIAALAADIICGAKPRSMPEHELASYHIFEAEARGAAEERAKSAEGNAVAWLIQDKSKGDPKHAHTPDRAVTDKSHADHAARFNFNVFPLYTHPANVAALEAWVKELEDALTRIANSDTFCGSQSLRHTARAAVTREGGV